MADSMWATALTAATGGAIAVFSNWLQGRSNKKLKEMELQFEVQKIKTQEEVSAAREGMHRSNLARKAAAVANAKMLKLKLNVARADSPADMGIALQKLEDFFEEHPVSLTQEKNWEFSSRYLSDGEIARIAGLPNRDTSTQHLFDDIKKDVQGTNCPDFTAFLDELE